MIDVNSSKIVQMSFGKAAIIAANFIIEKKFPPQDAWSKAVAHIFPNSISNQLKGCPKNTFLGICEEGYVKGVNPGKYTRSDLNKNYGIAAIQILAGNRANQLSTAVLWKAVLKQLSIENKQHNSQMNVVLALWNEGLIVV